MFCIISIPSEYRAFPSSNFFLPFFDMSFVGTNFSTPDITTHVKGFILSERFKLSIVTFAFTELNDVNTDITRSKLNFDIFLNIVFKFQIYICQIKYLF